MAFMRPVALALFGVLTSVTLGVQAQATPVTKQVCVDAYRNAQPLSRAGSLTKARELLLICARDPCPPALQGDCVVWLDEVAQRMPSIVVTLRDGNRVDIPEAALTIDGAAVSPRLDGREVEIDPGEHVITVQPVGKELMTQVVVAQERERGRKVTFELAPLEPPPTAGPVARGPLPWTFWTATAVTGVGLAGFGVFGARGLSERSDLESCSPTCSDAQLRPTRTSFLIADISLAVAVIAAGAATLIYFTRPPARTQSAALAR